MSSGRDSSSRTSTKPVSSDDRNDPRGTPRIKVKAITSLEPRETRVQLDAGAVPRGWHTSTEEAIAHWMPTVRRLEGELERTLQRGE